MVAAHCEVARLVFLAAVIPQIGASFLERFRATPEMLCPDWIGKDPTKDEAAARHFLFHDCDARDLPWALTTLRLMFAREALVEVCPLREWPSTPSSYILAAEDRTLRPDWWRRAARELLGSDPIEMEGGHCPHVARPQELARVLVSLDR